MEREILQTWGTYHTGFYGRSNSKKILVEALYSGISAKAAETVFFRLKEKIGLSGGRYDPGAVMNWTEGILRRKRKHAESIMCSTGKVDMDIINGLTMLISEKSAP